MALWYGNGTLSSRPLSYKDRIGQVPGMVIKIKGSTVQIDGKFSL